jgi:parallel beta-helix repeat protein
VGPKQSLGFRAQRGFVAAGAVEECRARSRIEPSIAALNGAGAAGRGIDAGDGSTVSSSKAEGNGLAGIRVGNRSGVLHCTAPANGQDGISAGAGVSLIGCVASGNTGAGFTSGTAANLEGCVATDNTGKGFVLLSGTVSGCTASRNGDSGFSGGASPGVTLHACTATHNQRGISLTYANVVACTALSNQIDGIFVGIGLVQGCVSRDNGVHGIHVNRSVLVRGNTSDHKGTDGTLVLGAGIKVLCSSESVRIEGNHVSQNDLGVSVPCAAAALVTGNTASGNGTEYDIVPGNRVGTIQTSPVGAGPWDNFDL